MTSCVGTMHINLPHVHTWDCFEEVVKVYDNQFGGRISNNIVCNVE
jgi:hypothetical protein